MRRRRHEPAAHVQFFGSQESRRQKSREGIKLTRDQLKNRVRDAFIVWSMMPDRERKYLKPKWGLWPDMIQKQSEAYGYNRARVPRFTPTSFQISQAEQLTYWLSDFSSNGLERYNVGLQIMWGNWGMGRSLSDAGRFFGCKRVTAQKRRDAAVSMILLKISRDEPGFLGVRQKDESLGILF